MAKKPTYEELEQRVKRLEKESFEHKRAEEERELTLSQLRATLEATVDGIMVVRLDSETKSLSKRFRKIWHMPDAVLDSEDANQVFDYVLDQINEPEVFSQKVQAVVADPNSNTFDTLPDSTISPWRMTQTRSALFRTMGRSWVISSMAIPSSL